MALRIYYLARWLHLRHIPVLPALLKAFNRIAFAVVLPPSAVLGCNVLLSYNGLGTRVRQLDAQVIDCYEPWFKNVYYKRESCCG